MSDPLAQNERAAAILYGMRDGVLAVDDNNRVVLVNPALQKIFGSAEEELLGKTPREALRNNAIADLINRTRQNGKALEEEINAVLPVAGDFIVRTQVVGTGKISVICVLSDITELKKLENYRTEFVANVSHELKTPLATIHSYVQTLQGGAINDPEHNLDFLEKIDKHVLQLSVLIDDILEISQLESKEGLAPFSKVNIRETTERAVDAVAERCAKKKIILKKEFSSDDCLVRGLEDHIYRAILNLLENALTYTAEGGSITVACMKQADKVMVSVEDTGIGIPAEHLPRIFERFYRVDPSRSRELGGTGLGLAIVKHVMHIHNGAVTVESPPAACLPDRQGRAGEVGKGSKFRLMFSA